MQSLTKRIESKKIVPTLGGLGARRELVAEILCEAVYS